MCDSKSFKYHPFGRRIYKSSSSSTSIYVYDSNGNTLTSVTGSNTTTYAWDFENRLSSVTLPGSGGTVTFKYDPFGRRIYKSSSGGTSVYAYDDDNLVEETNAAGAVVARYSQTQNIDEPLAMLRSAATSYYHADGLGSVTSLSNAAGSIANTYTYDSFGKLTASTGSLVNPFRYTARESDTETGLYFYRARYYDTSVGRFVSEDPAGFYGGFDFYNYTKNNAVNFVDPTGLKCEQITPWTEVPGMWPPGGPKPYLTITDGVFWVRTGWGYASLGLIPDYTHCVCEWIATHTRVRKFYSVPITEQAEFQCACPPSTVFRTRTRMKEYEEDSPDKSIIPWSNGTTSGSTYQAGDLTGSNPRDKRNVGCTCKQPTP